MRASLLTPILVFFLLLFALPGCDRSDDPTPQDSALSGETAQSGQEARDGQNGQQDDADLFVAAGGAVEIALEDVEAAVGRLRLMAPRDEEGRMPSGLPDAIVSTSGQISLVRNLVHFQIVRHAAEERGIEITAEEERDFVARQAQLRHYLPLFDAPESEEARALKEELQEFELSVDDIRHLARDIIANDKLTDALIEEFSDENLWALYQRSRDEVDLLIALIPNSPASHEVDAAVERFDAQIRARYREHRDRFATAPMVRATIFQPGPNTAPDSIEERLQQATRRLKAGEEPQAIAEDTGLLVVQNATLLRSQNREAFEAEVGATGITMRGRRGPMAWRVEERVEGERRPLDRPLKREIAAELLREEGIIASNMERARQAQQIFESLSSESALTAAQLQALTAALEAADFRPIHTDVFSIHASVIPNVGLAPLLSESIKERTLADPVTPPILDRDRVIVARVIDRRHPDRADFEAEKEEFRAQFVERNRQRFTDEFATKYQNEHNVTVNMSVVARHYGTQNKKPQDVVRATPPVQ